MLNNQLIFRWAILLAREDHTKHYIDVLELEKACSIDTFNHFISLPRWIS